MARVESFVAWGHNLKVWYGSTWRWADERLPGTKWVKAMTPDELQANSDYPEHIR